MLHKRLHGAQKVLVLESHCRILPRQEAQHLIGMMHLNLLYRPQIKVLVEMSEALSNQQFADKVNAEGGASRSFSTFKPAESPGVMVSIPGAERITDAPMTSDQASRFRKDYDAQATGKDYQGAWKSGNKVFHDMSRKHTDLDSARKAGEKGKQIAGYDLGKTDIRRPEGGDIYFSRSVPGVESNPEFQKSAVATSQAERMSIKPKAQEFAEQSHISRGATIGKRSNKGTRAISINEVYAKIAKNRRNRGV